MWTSTGTVLTVSSRAMVLACERLGLDTGAMLRAVGIRRQTLEDPDARLEASKASALWAKAYELSGDPVTFDVEDESGPAGVSRPYAEFCFAAFVLHVRAATGVSFPLRRVTFVHRTPPDITEHERIFGCPVQFEAEHNRLSIDRPVWQTRTTSARPGVLQVLTEHADLLLQKLPRGPDLVERTRRVIGERLRGGDSSLESVARELGMSARSLQRHLRELGYSYQALADEVRAATARLYLDQPDIAIAEVAYLLGFADQSTFNRAFKRWTGNTPARSRALLRSPGGAGAESRLHG